MATALLALRRTAAAAALHARPSGARIAVAQPRPWQLLSANPTRPAIASALLPSGPFLHAAPASARWFRGGPKGRTGSILNDNIKPPSGMIRLIDADGTNRGIVPVSNGLVTAKSHNLDLVQMTEIPKDPEEAKTFAPVCKVLDSGKLAYDQQKKLAEKKAQIKAQERASTVKEIKVGTSISDHDLSVKLKRAKEFLEKNYSVRLTLVFRRSTALAPNEREGRAFEIVRLAEEEFKLVGRELESQRKVMKGSLRSLFVPL